MTNVENFAGFDVSKNSFDVCLLSGDGGSRSCRLTYDLPGLKSLIKLLPAGIHCIMEATGPYYLRLACWLHQHGFVISVINPLVIRRFSQMRLLRAKTDKADAKMIAAYGQIEKPKSWQPPARHFISLQQMEAVTDQLIKQRTAWQNQLKAFEASGMMEVSMKKFLLKTINYINKQLKEIESRMDILITKHYGEMSNNLVTIPGLGKKSAAVLIVLTGGFSRFKNYKQLSSYVGLSPRIFESGSSVRGKARICKMGMSRIRALLYVCAWSAKKCNATCSQLYERLVAKGKSKRLALIAVANKLIKQAFCIATKNTQYDINYSKNICF